MRLCRRQFQCSTRFRFTVRKPRDGRYGSLDDHKNGDGLEESQSYGNQSYRN